MKDKLLVINLGSTSTKLAIYQNGEKLWQDNIEHDPEYMKQFNLPYEQLDMRTDIVREAMEKHGDKPEELVAIVTRGGLLPPVASGAYEVNPEMIEVLKDHPMNHHISNVACAVGYNIAKPLGIKAYIYDPVTVDEMIPLVRITGLKEIRRHGQGHNLNMRATALRYCKENGLDYKEKNIIVAHLGGGITFTLHSKGRMIDMISDDEGAFSPERASQIPAFKLLKYVFDHDLNYSKAMKVLQKKGGLTSLLGTQDARDVEKMIADGDENAKLVYEAMALGVARSIAKLAVVVNGNIDVILLTGGIAYSKMFTEMVIDRVKFIAPVVVMPGENEMQALAEGAYRVLNGEEEAHIYHESEEKF
ncbi:MAG: butyrate kinase [Erysipelotrichaceae bacterium]|nr:butyrate kinase [Erysipelotrichaceae bacterium]